jgi:O-antigen ligase
MAVGVRVDRPGLDPRWLALSGALLAPVLGAAAVVSPLAALAGTAALLFVVLAFYDLAAGVALFASFTFLETLPAGADGGLGIVKVGGFVLVLAAVRRSGTPFLLRELPGVAFVATFLAGWALASSLWARDAGHAAGEGLRLLLDVLLIFVVFAAVQRARDARLVVWGYLAGGIAAALLGLATPSEDFGSRLAGGLGEPNFLAATLIPAFVFSVFALGWTSRAAHRWLAAGCALVFLLAILLTQSRGGLVALAVTFAVALLFAGPVRRYWLGLAALAVPVGLAYYVALASPEALQRVLNPGGGTGRADLWSVASDVASDHPVLGVGAGNFPLVAPEYSTAPINLPSAHLVVDTPKVAHNTYLGVLADLGLVGLIAFVAVVLGALLLARRSALAFARLGQIELELLSRAVFVGLVGMLAAFVFLSGEYEKQLWLLLGLAVALHGLARRRAREARMPRAIRPARARA